jgi:uncharacterized protein YbbC (DUF1343 family)
MFALALALIVSCTTSSNQRNSQAAEDDTMSVESPPAKQVIVGAHQLDLLATMVGTSRVALVVNYTAMVGNTHLADTLRSRGVNVVKIMSPEHGFRGTATAGEHVKDGVDEKTGLPVISLYGNSRKPNAEHLADVDVIVFDIQDVGVRFFTYIGTLHYVMEACAEHGKKLVVLDRPNPNGSYVDGPVLQMKHKSFIGMHPVPVVHGMTVGEYAQMINGEGWLTGGIRCSLEVVKIQNWVHNDPYVLPIKPSPNLPNQQAVLLYPTICFFEGTPLSLGRGTEMPFQVLGHPDLENMTFSFTPTDIAGMSIDPPQEGKLCHGLDLRTVDVPAQIELHYLIDLYTIFPDKKSFFVPNFARWAGNDLLAQQIRDGMSEEQIRATWQPELDHFKIIREKYLLYQ